MSRLTKWNRQGQAVFNLDSYVIGVNPIEAMLEKLAHYEDLEEQGRIIKLPCKFGEDAWFVCKHLIYGEVGDAAEVKWFVDKRQFNFANYVSHQRMAYATKEEAEAKLAELKGDTNEL